MRRKTSFKKSLAIFLSLMMAVSLMSFTSKPVVNAQEENVIGDALKIRFDEPVSQGPLPGSAGGFSPTTEDNRWQQLSLPIGNSYMGANVFGEISEERLTFNHKTLWTGGPDANGNASDGTVYNGGNKESVTYGGVTYTMDAFIKKIQEEFLKGNTSTASSMCGYLVGKGSNSGYGAYQSFADIYLDFGLSGTATNYERNLDLTKAIANVDFDMNGTHYHREFLASYVDNVLIMKVSSEGSNKLNFNVSFPVDNGETGQNIGTNGKEAPTTVEGNDTLVLAGKMLDNDMKLNGRLKVVLDANNGSVSGSGDSLTVSDASVAYIFLSASTDYQNEWPSYRSGESDQELNDRVKGIVDAAVAKGYEQVKADAISDYQNIFNRVTLDLGQGVSDKTTDQLLSAYNSGSASDSERRQLETTMFQYGRYLQIASSRANDLPANLQGVWQNRAGSSSYIPWASDYHMNVNLQMNYWPTYVTNMAECGIPLIDYVDSLRKPGRVTAKLYHGIENDENYSQANGFSAHTQNTIFGWTCPGWSFDWGWSPAAVPWILQNVYEYYEYTLNEDLLRNQIYPMLKEEALFYEAILIDDGNGRLVTAPAYSSEHGPRTLGNTYENGLAWQLFNDCIEAANTLGVDQDKISTWESICERLDPIEIGDDGQIKEWYSETTLGSVSGADRKHRHMSHLLELFPGDLINVDNNEYLEAAIVSLTDRGDNATGWGMGQRLNCWARVGDGNHAYDIIKAFFRSGAYPNLWDAHAPFQIDGNFGYTSGVAEMLLQSNLGYINLLPALSDDWSNGSVKGLIARGNFEVNMDWQDSNLTSAQITSKSGGTCTLQYYQLSDATISDSQGNVVTTTKINDNKVSFESVEGETYTISNISEKPIEAPENIKAYKDNDNVLFDFDEVATATSYSIYRSSDGTNYELMSDGITQLPYVTTSDGTQYTYKIASVDANGEGLKSKAINPVDISAYPEKIDDRDSIITYTSGWGDYSDSGQYEGTEKYCYDAGNVATFYFSGNSLKVIGMKAGDTHTFDLYIDGVKVKENVNTQSNSGSIRQQLLTSVEGLEQGIHKVELVITQGKISLDAFEYTRASDVTTISIQGGDSVDLNTTSTLQLSYEYHPSNTGNGINWSVKNELGENSNIATISDSGLLTLTGTGKVIVEVCDKNDESIKASKIITVTRNASATKYDDRDTSITYGNNWSPWEEDKHYSGTVTESTTLDASFNFDFTGTGVALYFMKLERSGSTAGGQIEVTIDDTTYPLVSTFSSVVGSEPQQKVFEVNGLSNTTHHVVVKLKGCNTSEANGCSPKCSFDYYEVLQQSSEELDYSELKAAILTYRETDLTNYTQASVQAYREAYEAALDKYEAASNQMEVDSAVNALNSAKTNLQAKANDKSALQAKINEAAAKKASDYTVDSFAALTAALNAARLVNENAEATQEEVNAAKTTLEEAIAGLVDKPQPPVVDKTALNNKISEAQRTSTEGKSEESIKALEDAIKVALEVNSNADATQEDVNNAVTLLDEAIKGLVDKPIPVNKDALKQAITRASIYVSKNLSTGNKDPYDTQLANAKAIMDKKDATQGEVDAATKALRDAIKSIDSNMKFPDVKENQWYIQVVDEAFARGLMGAEVVDKNLFKPDNPITRGMVATVLYRMAGSPKVEFSAKFPDVKDNLWYSSAIIWANQVGVVKGYDTGKFGPDDKITRQDLAIMLRNYAEKVGKLNVNAKADLTNFKDVKSISPYALPSVEWAVANKLISGKENGSKVAPIDNATRAECAKMFTMLQDLIVK